MQLHHIAGEHPAIQDFVAQVRDIAALSSVARRQFVEHPAFLCWLRQTSPATAKAVEEGAIDAELTEWLTELPSLRARIAAASKDVHRLTVNESIEIRRHDVDPLIAAISPPTYTFKSSPDSRLNNNENGYTLPFFRNVAEVTLGQIRATWPEIANRFSGVVHTLIHVPDGDFRSASANRYTGVVFLSSDDDSLLGLEESLVHEFSHQVLYRVMELDPLVLNSTDDNFQLPWSGSERDYFGFFHAFYVYIILALYYSRVAARRDRDRGFALARRREIVRGIEAAVPEIVSAGQFTSTGKIFVKHICRKARNLAVNEPEGSGA